MHVRGIAVADLTMLEHPAHIVYSRVERQATFNTGSSMDVSRRRKTIVAASFVMLISASPMKLRKARKRRIWIRNLRMLRAYQPADNFIMPPIRQPSAAAVP
jgi:hypothetical protein